MVAWSRSRIKLDTLPPIKEEEDAIVSISRSADSISLERVSAWLCRRDLLVVSPLMVLDPSQKS